MLDELEAAQQEVLNSGGKLNGVLRISTPLSFGVAHMSGAIAQFMHAHPEIRIEMDLSDKRVDLVAEGFDLAIRIGVLSGVFFFMGIVIAMFRDVNAILRK